MFPKLQNIYKQDEKIFFLHKKKIFFLHKKKISFLHEKKISTQYW